MTGAGGRLQNAVARLDAVVEEGRLPLFVDEAVAAEDAFFRAAWRGQERGWMMAPVQQVQAGDVSPAVDALVLVDVVEVVAPVPEEGSVGIGGAGEILGWTCASNIQPLTTQQAQEQGQLTPMVDFMLHDVPDNPA